MSVCGWQLKAAIANVWDFHNRRVTEVSLFSSHIVPDFMLRREAVNDEELAQESSLPNAEPLLYIGLFVFAVYSLLWFFFCGARLDCVHNICIVMLFPEIM